MFETELILWLQSFSTDWLTVVMRILTQLADSRTFLVLAVVVTFAYDFQKGFVLFQLVMWNGALTNFLKNAVALPRPAEVDAAVELLDADTTNATPFVAADGDNFFDLPEAAAIEHVRGDPDVIYGFPSGYVSTGTSIGLASALLGRSGKIAAAAFMYVLLVAVSRMYLGYTFLADVLGGLVVGTVVLVGIRLALKAQSARVLLRLRSVPPTWRSPQKAVLALLLIVPPLLLLVLGAESDFLSVGRLLAANIAFGILFLRGLPAERPTIGARIARAALALVLLAVTTTAMQQLVARVGLEGTDWGNFWTGFVPPFAYLLGTVHIGAMLGVYWRRNDESRKHLQFLTHYTIPTTGR